MADGVVSFLTSREFVTNFVANLGGAMGGVLLAFWIERIRVRRDTQIQYGRVLRTSHSELAYLKPMCEHGRDSAMAGEGTGTVNYFSVPATKALLISPLVHDQAPYSLIMAVSALCLSFDATEPVVRSARESKPTDLVARDRLNKTLGDQLDKASSMMAIALQQIDSQLNRLGLEKTADAETQQVSRRLLEVLNR